MAPSYPDHHATDTMRVAFLLLLALLGAAVRGAQANRRYNYTVTVGPWAPFPLDPNDSSTAYPILCVNVVST